MFKRIQVKVGWSTIGTLLIGLTAFVVGVVLIANVDGWDTHTKTVWAYFGVIYFTTMVARAILTVARHIARKIRKRRRAEAWAKKKAAAEKAKAWTPELN